MRRIILAGALALAGLFAAPARADITIGAHLGLHHHHRYYYTSYYPYYYTRHHHRHYVHYYYPYHYTVVVR